MRFFIFFLTFFLHTKILGQTTVRHIQVHGLDRTSEDWLHEQLPFSPPFVWDEAHKEATRQSLGKQNIFWNIYFSFENTTQTLHIHLQEKWTTIPVIRGEFGGGTGLTILGGYDTHILGRRWTFGAETRKYGVRPTGGVAYLRIPEIWKQYVALDAWDIYREQNIHHGIDHVATLCSHQQKVRARLLHHFSKQIHGGWDHSWIRQNASEMKVHQETKRPDIPLSSGYNTQSLLSFIYDHIHIDSIRYDGLRMITRAGWSTQSHKFYPKWDIETFYYHALDANNTIAWHTFWGQNKGQQLSDWFLLGGFDSVRGIPDGAMVGQRAAYSNLEWRHIIHKWNKIWLQGVAFIDAGGTEHDYADAIGAGVRIAVPQVHRMMLRIDYAISRQGFSGISIGLNHFFQPYRPL